MQHLDDAALIKLVDAGDTEALSVLYDRYSRLVFSVAYGVVHEQGAAEEITLDIFTRVWEKASTYRPERAKVYTWLTRMTRNRAIDNLRREKVRPMLHSISWADVSNEPLSTFEDPESAAQLTIQQETVKQAIAALPETQQEVLALAYFGGLSHSEIAKELDLPLGTVKGRIRSGLKKLRDLLQDE